MQILITIRQCNRQRCFSLLRAAPRRLASKNARLAAVLLLCYLATGVSSAVAREPKPIDFNHDIRPILSDKCFHCHGPDASTREADLRLDVQEQAKGDRGGYVAVAPGDLETSELVRRIISDDASARMPPEESGKSLSPKEVKLLRRWVAEGAPWALAWSYVPPQRHPVPDVRDEPESLPWIDAFVRSRLKLADLRPSPQADPVTLIRRLSFDLTGLPPTPAEVDRFLADQSPEAYERLVDGLLDSPRFGERMATYWLDLVRYADTTGYAGDQEHHISPYRDYVIDAFNRNLPFDQFTREQLAGDLLPAPTLEQLIATGYNRLLQTSHEGGVQVKEYLAIYGADRVRNVSAVWMGATVGCAQCHDHKFDPYTAKDFYSLQAFFADVDEADHLRRGRDVSPTVRAPEMVVYPPGDAAELAALVSRLDELAARLQAADGTAAENPKIAGGKKDAAPEETASSTKELHIQIDRVQARIKTIQRGARKTMITVAIEPRTIRVLPRGNWQDDSGAIVQPAIPEFLGTLDTNGRRANRLDLANWLVDAERGVGGLTARVMVNRFWHLLFGRGLAADLDDFGGQGEPPDYPELLDALAVEFVESGWNVKRLLKEMTMSHTYRQTSLVASELLERDPLNLLLARQARYRLPAEMVRDSLLDISVLLVQEVGGPSIRPYQPDGYYRHLNFPKREYRADTDSRQWRRGLYMHWQRQFLHPMLKAFDAPTREECTAERPRSNTPLAALVLLNDPSFIEAARAFAQRMLIEGGATVKERLRFAFRQAVSRELEVEESQLLIALLDASRAEYAADSQAAEALLSIGAAPRPDGLDPTELAAYTIVARAILSMNETLTRN